MFKRSGKPYKVAGEWFCDFNRRTAGKPVEGVSVSYRSADADRKAALEIFDRILKGLNDE